MANRYTQVSPTQFNPLSLEELAIVPNAMRQKHDAALTQLETQRSQLNALRDFLPQQSEYGNNLINDLESQISKQSESLANSGYNQMVGSNLIKTNAYFQKLVGPNGEVGRLQAAKKAMSEEYKSFMENAQKAGHDSLTNQRNWAKHVQNYSGFDEEGNVTNIGSLGIPEKYEMIDFAKEWKPLLGTSKRRLDRPDVGSVSFDRNTGQLTVYNKSGSVHELTNDPQIRELGNLAYSSFMIPGSKGFNSAVYSGKNLELLNEELNSMLGLMRKHEITDTTSINRSVKFEDMDKIRNNESMTSGFDPLTAAGDFNLPTYAGAKNKQEVINAYTKITSGKKPTPEEAAIYDNFMKSSGHLVNTEAFQAKLKKQQEAVDEFEGDFNPLLVEINKTPIGALSDGDIITYYSPETGKRFSEHSKEGKQYQRWSTKYSKLTGDVNNQLMSIAESSRDKTHSYRFDEGVTPYEKRVVANLKSKIRNDIAGPGANFTNNELMSVKEYDSKTTSELNTPDKKQDLQNRLMGIDPEKVNFGRVVQNGPYTTYQVQIPNKKDPKVNDVVTFRTMANVDSNQVPTAQGGNVNILSNLGGHTGAFGTKMSSRNAQGVIESVYGKSSNEEIIDLYKNTTAVGVSPGRYLTLRSGAQLSGQNAMDFDNYFNTKVQNAAITEYADKLNIDKSDAEDILYEMTPEERASTLLEVLNEYENRIYVPNILEDN